MWMCVCEGLLVYQQIMGGGWGHLLEPNFEALVSLANLMPMQLLTLYESLHTHISSSTHCDCNDSNSLGGKGS